MSQTELDIEQFDSDDLYQGVVDDMYALYDNTITEGEAREAASNLIGFCKTLLEIKMEKEQCTTP